LIRTYWYQNHIPAVGKPPSFDVSKLDWKRFLCSATGRPFDADQFGNWRWYWDFGGGAMTDLFVDWVDVAHWIMGADMPSSAEIFLPFCCVISPKISDSHWKSSSKSENKTPTSLLHLTSAEGAPVCRHNSVRQQIQAVKPKAGMDSSALNPGL